MRIRTLKPELLTCERFAKLDDTAARMFLSLPPLADDAGNCQAGPRYINGAVFCEKPRSLVSIGKLLGVLEAARLIDRYEVDGAQYLAILGWSEKSAPTYQRIDKPQAPKFPLPTSTRSWNSFDAGREGKGSDPIRPEGRGSEGKGKEVDPVPSSPASGGLMPPTGGSLAEEAAEEITLELEDGTIVVTNWWWPAPTSRADAARVTRSSELSIDDIGEALDDFFATAVEKRIRYRDAKHLDNAIAKWIREFDPKKRRRKPRPETTTANVNVREQPRVGEVAWYRASDYRPEEDRDLFCGYQRAADGSDRLLGRFRYTADRELKRFDEWGIPPEVRAELVPVRLDSISGRRTS